MRIGTLLLAFPNNLQKPIGATSRNDDGRAFGGKSQRQ
jgi:hypothetical protein